VGTNEYETGAGQRSSLLWWIAKFRPMNFQHPNPGS